MSEAIRVGLIGFGFAGRIFHAPVISAVPGLELSVIVQRSGDSAAQAYPQTKTVRSAQQLLADGSVRLIVVATPNDSHFDLAKQALETGHDVVVDKPITLTSEDAAALAQIARKNGRLLSAYQSRRWDGDFITVRAMLEAGTLGRLVSFESHFDRWRPQRVARWRENAVPGAGTLFDLGPHLVDQALMLFEEPEAVLGDVRAERDGAVVDDAFDIKLYYPGLTVLLRQTCLAAKYQPRFVLEGTSASYVKHGLDPQEEALKNGRPFDTPDWGADPKEKWGELTVMQGDQLISQSLPTAPGDYRGYYANIRDALKGEAALAVTPAQAWRTMRVLECARESNAKRAAVACDFSNPPA